LVISGMDILNAVPDPVKTRLMIMYTTMAGCRRPLGATRLVALR
jgi:hypothetical protein